MLISEGVHGLVSRGFRATVLDQGGGVLFFFRGAVWKPTNRGGVVQYGNGDSDRSAYPV